MPEQITSYFETNDPKKLKKGGCMTSGPNHFLFCPCGERTVMLGPGHGLTVAEDGAVTTKHSIGYNHADGRPENWCHWQIKDGKPYFHADAQCPGSSLSY